MVEFLHIFGINARLNLMFIVHSKNSNVNICYISGYTEEFVYKLNVIIQDMLQAERLLQINQISEIESAHNPTLMFN